MIGPSAFHGPGSWRTTPAGAVRSGDWKLLEFFEDGRLELYNLREDIGERHDHTMQRPDIVRRLRTLVDDWARSVDADAKAAQ